MSYDWFWAEGALETAEYALEEVYGLARPSDQFDLFQIG
jgi:hypothetical protein